MRLIDADEIIKETWGVVIKDMFHMDETVDVISRKDIDNAPTIDAEPVVRCKDCRFFHNYGFKLEYTECTHFDCDVTENGYCWWGERKENETN